MATKWQTHLKPNGISLGHCDIASTVGPSTAPTDPISPFASKIKTKKIQFLCLCTSIRKL